MHSNAEMDVMLNALEPLLERRDLIGYAAARNTRILQSELTEYYQRRDELVRTYGEPNTDENGNPDGTYSIRSDSENWPKFEKGLEQFAAIEHDPQLMTVPGEEAIGQLSGQEVLSIDWMLEF